MSDSEQRGKYIYEEGKSRSRRTITADLQKGEAPAPASILPCINCHGADGQGAEDYSGIAPLNVNWFALALGGEHEHSNRRHAPFDEKTFARSIAVGLDPAGNELDSSMPRYNMAPADMSDLIAYLKVMDSQSDPGIASDEIRIGTVLPLKGKHAGLGAAMRNTIEAYFASINAHGGVHGRRLELVVAGWGENDDPPIWAARDLVDNEPLFALVSGFVPNYDAEYDSMADEKKIPLIGPYTALPPNKNDDGNQNGVRYAFYSLAGIAHQAEVLVEAAAADHGSRDFRLAVVNPEIESVRQIADAAIRRADKIGFEPVVTAAYRHGQLNSQAIVAKLRKERADAVVFLGSADELVQFSSTAVDTGWLPYLLAPGLLAESRVFDVPKSFSGRLLLAYASLPTDYSAEGAASFERLHEESDYGYDYSIAQIAAYTAATISVEGLQRAGRNLDREQFLTSLEGLDNFHPGLVPPVSYGPDRRIGTLGGHVVRADLIEGRFEDDTTWIDLD